MITAPAWTDEDTVDLITDCLDAHHDMDVTFHNHAHYIVEALRRAGLLSSLSEMREELAGLTGRAQQILGERFAFASTGIWPANTRHAAVTVYFHMTRGRASVFPGETMQEAIAAADKWLDEQDPRRLEREGWAILGVEHAA